jgi:uncharacterized protein YacL
MFKTMYTFGWIIIVIGFFVGAVLGGQQNLVDQLTETTEKTFHWNVALTYWISGLFTGLLFIAVGSLLENSQEIIKNQHAIMSKFEIPLNVPDPVQADENETVST